MSDPGPPQQNQPPQSPVNIALLIIGVLVFLPGAFCTLSMAGSMFTGSSDGNSDLDVLLLLVFGVPSVGLAVFGAWLIRAALPRRHS